MYGGACDQISDPHARALYTVLPPRTLDVCKCERPDRPDTCLVPYTCLVLPFRVLLIGPSMHVNLWFGFAQQVLPNFVSPPPGKSWSQWPPLASAIVDNAGRRTGPLPDPVAPALSPPAEPPRGSTGCLRLGAFPCVAGKVAQQWFLSGGSTPGDGKLTVLRSARTTTVANGSTLHSCMKTNYAVSHPADTCNLHNAEIDCAGGCAPL